MSDIFLCSDSKEAPTLVTINGRRVPHKNNEGRVMIPNVEQFAEHGKALAVWPTGERTDYNF